MESRLGIPFVGPLAASMIQGRNGDRAVGTAAALGLSLAILRLVVNLIKAEKDSADDDMNDDKSPYTAPWYPYLLRLLRTLVNFDEDRKKQRTLLENGVSTQQYKGCCHCQSVQFETEAPKTLHVRCKRPGKIQYRHIQVAATKFQFTKGMDALNIYYVNNHRGNSTVMGAHTFCGRCGVHVLYAPSSTSSMMQVNVDCLESPSFRIVLVDDFEEDESVAAPGQWQEETEVQSQKVSHSISSLSDHVQDLPGVDVFKGDDGRDGSMGTPSTMDTSTVESIASAVQLHIEEAASVHVREPAANKAKPLVLSPPPPMSSPSTPPSADHSLLRDQLKYYMGKHLSQPEEQPQAAKD